MEDIALDHRFTTVFENAPVMMFLLDGDARVQRANRTSIQFTNRAARELMGLGQGDVLGCFNALERKDGCGSSTSCGSCVVRRAVRATFDQGICQHNVEACLLVDRRGTAREMHIQMSTSPMDVNGRRLVLVCIQDLTPQKRTEVELRQALQELKEANEKLKGLDRLKSEFVSTASHELRTPLAIIREFVALVLDRVAGPINESQHECLSSALDNCDRLGTIINDLLDLEQIESGKVMIQRGRQDLAIILKQCAHDFLPRCTSKNQTFCLEIPGPLPDVLCDRDKIIQVLVNLIGNANKFTPEGGKVVVRAFAGEGQVRVEIEDDGPGISREDHEKIFEKFTQLRRNDSEGAKGSGLGLAISKRLMELHEGDILLESGASGGAKFTLTLPVFEEGSELSVFIKDKSHRLEDREKDWTLALLKAAPSFEGETGAVLQQVETVARRTMRLEDATMLLEDQGLLAVLIQSNEKGARSFLARMASSIEEALGMEATITCALHRVSGEEAVDLSVDRLDGHFRSLRGEPLPGSLSHVGPGRD